jgi:hypothetical protein
MSSAVTLQMCDPREYETQIKDLFTRNGKAGIHDVFERAYRRRAERGLKSWIGLVDGRVVMHISVTPQRFVGPDGPRTAGILGDLMADEEHRDFWAPVKLLRKMVGDVKRAGEIDFLISTTVADAESVFKAGGFKPYGSMHRYVMPLYWPYLMYARIKGRVARRKFKVGNFEKSTPPTSASPAFRPDSDAEFYQTRIPRSDFSDGTWLEVDPHHSAAGGYALVSRKPTPPELMLADAFWDQDRVHLPEVVHAAARWGRRQGFNKLATTTLHESDAGRQLQKCGFFPRGVTSLLLVQQTGPNAPPPVEQWFLLGFALTGW